MPCLVRRILLAVGLASIAGAPAFAQTGSGLASSAPAAVEAQQFIELERTPNMVELTAHFVNCPAPHRLKVQDGVMNVLRAEGQAPIRFVVKMHSPSDIRYYPVSAVAADAASGRPQGLRVGRGVSIVNSVAVDDLARAGVKTIAYTGTYPMAQQVQAQTLPGASPTPLGPMVCCVFNGCGGQVWRFCTGGSMGCGYDDCGGCCIDGGGGGLPEYNPAPRQ